MANLKRVLPIEAAVVAEPLTPEGRRDRRMRVFKSGRIVFNGGYSAADCLVKDLSISGARLQMDSAVGIPAQFDLLVDGVKRLCRVVWRSDRRMGVAFQSRGPTPVNKPSRAG